MARIHTLHNISNPAPPPKTFKDRYCPGMRSCWHLDVSKFNPANRDAADRNRRICMLVTLVSHSALAILGLVKTALALNPLGLFIHTIIALIFFFFTVSLLITIGDAEGERLVLGRKIGRWHFDAFLVFIACVYGSMFLGTFFAMEGLAGFFLAFAPLPMWLLMMGVAWVATWDTVPVSMV